MLIFNSVLLSIGRTSEMSVADHRRVTIAVDAMGGDRGADICVPAAIEMLSELTCYSATETFNEIARELAKILGISPQVAAELHLLPVAHTILEGAQRASSQFRVEAR